MLELNSFLFIDLAESDCQNNNKTQPFPI